jgi:hypothetical protein
MFFSLKLSTHAIENKGEITLFEKGLLAIVYTKYHHNKKTSLFQNIFEF